MLPCQYHKSNYLNGCTVSHYVNISDLANVPFLPTFFRLHFRFPIERLVLSSNSLIAPIAAYGSSNKHYKILPPIKNIVRIVTEVKSYSYLVDMQH